VDVDDKGVDIQIYTLYNFKNKFFIEDVFISRVGGRAPWIHGEQASETVHIVGIKKNL
jgi:hypothetical protein